MPDQDPRPNILFIMADQHRGDCLSLERHPVLQTPNIDQIGAEGVHFRCGYTPAPSCVPARRALMAGQHPATNGMVGMVDGCEWDPPATLPGELAKAGYQTALIGRDMHLYPTCKRYGFQEMHPIVRRDGVGTGYLERLQREGEAHMFGHGVDGNGWVARPWHLDESLHEVAFTVGESIKWLQRRDRTCPYFLVVSFAAPHPPLTPPRDYMDRYLGLDLPQPRIGDWEKRPANDGIGLPTSSPRCCLEGDRLRQAQAGYYGLINFIDDQIARLLGAHGGTPADARSNTIVVYTSDHGEMLGDHYLFRKTYPYEGSTRIPFLIRVPGRRIGRTCNVPVTLEDLMPTLLELAGCGIPPSVDGTSLVPLINGADTLPGRGYIHSEHARCYAPEFENHMLTDGKAKYIWFSHSGVEQLFDLVEDPGELHDLGSDPTCADELKLWRARLIETLTGRTEGFTDGTRLIAGRPYPAMMASKDPRAKGVC